MLTAAHCIAQFKQSWPERSLIVKLPEEPESSYSVSSWSLHPRYEKAPRAGTFDPDLAILKLSKTLRLKQLKRDEKTNKEKKKGFWMQGFSPIRLNTENVEAALKSGLSWSEMKIARKRTEEGKVELRPLPTQLASCPGDSGAPLWTVQNNEFTLHGVIVQGNCERGLSRAVLIEDHTVWLADTAKLLNESQQDQKQLSRIYRFHLSEVFHTEY